MPQMVQSRAQFGMFGAPLPILAVVLLGRGFRAPPRRRRPCRDQGLSPALRPILRRIARRRQSKGMPLGVPVSPGFVDGASERRPETAVSRYGRTKSIQLIRSRQRLAAAVRPW